MSRKLIVPSLAIAAILLGAGLWYIVRSSVSHQPLTITAPSEEEIALALKQEKLVCIGKLPLEMRIGQKIMAAGFAEYIEEQSTAFVDASIGGMIVMDEISTASITVFRDSMQVAPLIAVDQEGGSVQRYLSWGALASAEETARTLSPEQAYEQYLLDNQRLKEKGITTNFAPVVDVISRTPNPLPGRMYSSDPTIVTDYAGKAISAAFDAGITPVIKHFPGMGSATGNTDFTVASTDPFTVLQTRDLVPYEKLAGLQPDVMVGNMIVPGLTNDQPAIWSPEAITLLRSLGYENAVLYSDSLTARAVDGSVSEAATKSWAAGIDVAVIVQADTETPRLAEFFNEIIHSAALAVETGELSTEAINESTLRIFERKQVDPCSLES